MEIDREEITRPSATTKQWEKKQDWPFLVVVQLIHRLTQLDIRAPILVQTFAPLKAPLNILVIVLLRKFSKELSKKQHFCTIIGTLRPGFPRTLDEFTKSSTGLFEGLCI